MKQYLIDMGVNIILLFFAALVTVPALILGLSLWYGLTVWSMAVDIARGMTDHLTELTRKSTIFQGPDEPKP